MGKRQLAIYVMVLLFAVLSYATQYQYKDVFSIDVPDIFEARTDSASYTSKLDSLEIYSPTGPNCIIFQQKGLNDLVEGSTGVYSRIIITVDDSNEGNYLKPQEHPNLTVDDLETFRMLCDQQKRPFDYVVEPKIEWVELCEGLWAIRMLYSRTGTKGVVQTQIHIFQNVECAVMLVTSYRMSEKEMWYDAIESAIKSFSWTKPVSQNNFDAASMFLIVFCAFIIVGLIVFIINKTK